MADPRVLTPAEERLLDLSNSLWSDQSDAGRAFRAAAKAKYPDAVTPESQLEPIVEPLRAEVGALLKKLSDRDAADELRAKEQAERDAERNLSHSVDLAAQQFRLTDAGRELMIKRMQETGNHTDPLAAAAYIVAANPPPRDITGLLGPQNKVNLFGQGQDASDERMKKLLSDPMGSFLDAEFTDLLTDPRQYIVDAGLPDPGEVHY